MSNANTDALVPAAWVCPSRAPNWHAPGWSLGQEPPTPLTRPEAIARGWSPLYGPDTIERLTRERDEAVARERERCAAICESVARQYGETGFGHSAERAANAIRTTKAD